MPVSESDYGLSPAQYHAGLDRLWTALGVTGVQSDDVFTLCAAELTTLREQVRVLREAAKAAERCLQSIERNEVAIVEMAAAAGARESATSTFAGWKRNLAKSRAALKATAG